MTRRRYRRPGLGLTEVLVALFVMALGLIGLLTLFPIGAMSIAHGLKDDRCTETALQADGFLRAYWKANVVGASPTSTTGDYASPDGFVQAFTNSPPATTGPSNPILIDPVGWVSASPSTVAVATGGSLARRNLSSVTNDSNPTKAAFRTCGLLDDRTFEPNGDAADPLTRLGRYTWAALVQLPDAAVPAGRQPVTFKVLVFENRALGFFPAGSEVKASGTVWPTTATAGTARQIEVSKADVIPADPTALPLVRKGGWLAHVDTSANRRVDYYRITGITDGVAGKLILDVDRSFADAGGVSISIVLIAGLAEVFHRPPLGTTLIQ
ncbi:MAG: type IV pilus modification PilV family protein [Fimbriiglobus sp.]